jgi:hypothetical protein
MYGTVVALQTKDQIIQHRLELEARKAKLEEQLLEIQSKF